MMTTFRILHREPPERHQPDAPLMVTGRGNAGVATIRQKAFTSACQTQIILQ
ncbi:MAG: hypothetical protein UH625_10045 [Muribaculaceae bacterium]|nr:hypothetical protein [Muribaculaceae bacterium]